METEDLGGVSTALDLLVMYGGYNQSMEPARRIICNSSWFTPSSETRFQSHHAYWWADVAKVLCNHHQDVALALAELMLKHAGEPTTIVELLNEETGRVLDVALRQNPWEAWKMASSMLGPPIDAKAFVIGHWLRGSHMFGTGGLAHSRRRSNGLDMDVGRGMSPDKIRQIGRVLAKYNERNQRRRIFGQGSALTVWSRSQCAKRTSRQLFCWRVDGT